MLPIDILNASISHQENQDLHKTLATAFVGKRVYWQHNSLKILRFLWLAKRRWYSTSQSAN
jgi:hypothetical protein